MNIILANKVSKILFILKNIGESEDLIDCPVLIGSRAAKWHVPSFREPNDWDLIATPSQSILFINKAMTNATFKDIKLIHYPGAGLKIIGCCIELNTGNTDGSSINFDIEVVSDKVDLRKMKLNKAEENNKDNLDNVENDMDTNDQQTLKLEKLLDAQGSDNDSEGSENDEGP